MKIPAALLPSFLFLPAGLALATAQPKELHRTLPLDAKGEFSLRTHKGEVKLVAWDRPEVKIDARIEADADSSCGDDADQAEWIKNTEIRIQSSPSSVDVSTEYGQVNQGQWTCASLPFVKYQIWVPATARVRIFDHKSKIQVANLRGDLRIRTHKGKLDISGLEGALDLDTHKGEGRASFARWTEASRFRSHKGDLEIVIPKGTGLNLDADLGRRGHLDSELIGALDAPRGWDRLKSVQWPINGGGPKLRLVTHKGTFHLRQG